MGLTVAHSGNSANTTALRGRALRRAALIGGASALALTIAGPAFAQDGGGKGGDTRNLAAGGAGGAGPDGQDGADGTVRPYDGSTQGAGGGGGGAGGGDGGTGGAGPGRFSAAAQAGSPGGAGGTGPGGDGQTGGNSDYDYGAGGGGGGAHGISITDPSSVLSNTTVTGGAGGAGGDQTFGAGYGGAGGGGEGGYGLVFRAENGTLLSDNTSINGGEGGDGGDSGLSYGGSGGAGGGGAYFAGDGAILTNRGAITGGTGGAAGVANFSRSGRSGSGGSGVYGSNLTIINAGSISGGLSGDGATRANAVTFGAGDNVYEHRAGGSVTGAVVGDGDDLFRLGGDTAGSFNVGQFGTTYQGFSSFEKTGLSTFTLTGTTTQVTPWTISAGTLAISSDAALGDTSGVLTLRQAGGNQPTLRADADLTMARDIAVYGNGKLDTNDHTVTFTGSLIGDGVLSHQDTSGPLILSGTSSDFTGELQVRGATLRIENSAALDRGSLDLIAGTLDYADGVGVGNSIRIASRGYLSQTGGSATQGGEIYGGGLLVKRGSGNLILSGANSYKGGTRVDEGSLTLANDLAASTGTIVTEAGTALFYADGVDIANRVELRGDTTLGQTGGSATQSGEISGSGSLIKTGSGSLTLSGANSFDGLVTLVDGTLVLANNSALSTGSLGTYDGTTVGFADGVTIGNTIDLFGTTTFSQTSGSATLSGLVRAGGLTKTGAGNLTLSGGNQYDGVTTVSEGTLTITGGSALGTTAEGTVVEDGATLAIDGSSGVTVGENISIAGDGVSGKGALRNVAGITSMNGLVTLTGASTIASDSGILDLNGGITGTHDLMITGAGITVIDSNLDIGDGTLTKNGTGILSLWANNSFTGDVIVNSGQVVVGRPSNPGNAIDDAALMTINGSGIVSFDQDETIGALAGSGDVEARGALRTLTIAGSDSTTFSGRLTENTGFDGVLALTKRGSGNLTLSGNNSYSGVTTVSEGTLTATSGSALGSTAEGTVVADGATLALLLNDPSNEAISITGSGVAGNGALRNLAGTSVLGGAITLNGASTIASDGILKLTGGITGSHDLTLKGNNTINLASDLAIGDGTLTLDVAAFYLDSGTSFTGDVVANSGLIFINAGGASTIDDLARLTVNDASVLLNQDETIGSLGGSAGAIAGVNGARTLTVGGDGTSTSYAGILTESGTGGSLSLTKTGGGNLTLSGKNDYTGATTVAEGTLTVASQNALGALAGGTIVHDGATLALTTNLGLGEAFTIAGTGVSGNGALRNVSGYTTSSGEITLADASTISADSGSTLNLWGRISGAHDLTLQGGGRIGLRGGLAIGDGTLTINGASVDLESGNSFTGDVVMNSGLLEIDALGASTIDDQARLTVNGGEVVLSQNETIGCLAGIGGTIRATGTRTLAIGGDNTSTGFAGTVAGSLQLTKTGTGALTLTGTNTYTGATDVQAGTLYINGDQSAATGLTTINSGAALGGTGIIGGDVRLADFASLNPGTSPGTLTINGNLSLSGGSYLNYEFGEAGVVGGPLNDLVVVGGDLTLDGTLNVTQTQGGTFGPGVYRVINYGGTLTDNGLTLGSAPGNNAFVQTSVANQVNLVNTTGLAFSFWDGNTGASNDAVDGGSGIWQNSAGNHNWTDATGALNGTYDDGTFAIFQAAAGTVTIDNSLGVVTASGLQFATDGYRVAGGTLTLDGSPESIIRVGDGTAAGANITATIAADITGDTQLVKTDLGTLVLSGDNTYTGTTTVAAGTLKVIDNGNGLGSAAGGTIVADGATVDLDFVTTDESFTLSGAGINGLGALRGTRGFVNINGGILLAGASTIGSSGAFVSVYGGIAGDADLTIVTDDTGTIIFDSDLAIGANSLIKNGSGGLFLNADNSFTGDVIVNDGELYLGVTSASASRNLISDTARVTLSPTASLYVNQPSEVIGSLAGSGRVVSSREGRNLTVGGDNTSTTFEGTFAEFGPGTLALTKIGTGTLTLTGDSTYTGGTSLSAGGLFIGSGSALGTGALTTGAGTAVTLADGVTLANAITLYGDTTFGTEVLAFGEAGAATISGTISGTGALIRTDRSDLTLTGVNTYSGGTTLRGLTTITNGSALGTGTITAAGGALTIGADGIVLANDIDLQSGLNLSSTQNTVTLAGTISGSGKLSLPGTGTFILTGANSYSGGTFIVSGTARVANDSALGTGGLSLGTGATVDYADGVTIANRIETNNRFTLNQTGGVATHSGIISGATSFTKTGSGTLVLSGENTFTRSVTLSEGTLTLGNASALGTGALTAADGTTLRYDTDRQAVSNAIVLNGELGITANGRALQDGVISGSGGLRINAATILTGANTFSGGTTIESYGVTVRNDAALGTGDVTMGDFTSIKYADGTRLANDLTLNGTALLGGDGGYSATQSGAISGTGTLSLFGAGTMTLTGSNTYSGGTEMTEGTLLVGNDSALGTGTLSASGGTLGFAAADLTVANAIEMPFAFTVDTGTNSGTLSGVVSGNGNLTKTGAGTLTLTGTNSYTGATDVQAGTLYVNGDQSAATGLTSVADGATLGGTGTIGGDVTLADGASLNPGTSPGTLTINGNLALSGGSILNFEFGEAGVAGGALNDLVNVGGDLTLDGTLNVSPSAGGTFGAGVYRLFNYGGTLTDNGLTLGTTPTNRLIVQTSVANQVNLINATGATFSFWDGAAGQDNGTVDGGDGIWQTAAGNANWTGANGDFNGGYDDGTFAIFQGAAGTVTIDNSLGAVTASGLQFATDGYVIDGDTLTLDGAGATIRVGDGSAAGETFTATIAADVAGTAQLVKTDLGTLVLSGDNTYTGGTSLEAGSLVLGGDTALGTGALTTGAGTTVTLADGMTLTNAITLDGDTTFGTEVLPLGTLSTATISGTISGSGSLNRTNGSLIITGANTYSGGTTLGGFTTITNGSALGTGTITAAGGVLTLGADGIVLANDIDLAGNLNVSNGGNTVTLSGTISGTGVLGLPGSGATILTGANTYSGGTFLVSGTLGLGNDAALGTGRLSVANGTTVAFADGLTIANDIRASGRFVLDQDGGTATHSGVISGATSFTKTGSGTLVLAGANTIERGVTLSEGALILANDSALGTGTLTAQDGTGIGFIGDRTIGNAIALGGLVTFDTGTASVTHSGAISGGADGSLVKVGNGNLTLRGSSSYSGTTTVAAGTLTVASSNALGSTAGGTIVRNGATLAIDTFVTSENISIVGGGVDGKGALVGSGVLNGTVTLTDAAAIGGASGGGLTFTGAIQGNDTDLFFYGPGSTTISGGIATGSGDVIIDTNGGSVSFLSGNSFTGDLAMVSGALSINAGGASTIGDTARILATGGSITLAQSETVGSISGSGLTIAGIFRDQTLTTGGDDSSTTFSGTLIDGQGGTLALTKTGSGTFALTGGNTYSGGTTLNGGALVLGSDSALGTGLLTATDGTAVGFVGDRTIGNAMALGGAFTLDTGANSIIQNGVISGSGRLAKVGTGTLSLTAANTYSGTIDVQAGTLANSGTVAAVINRATFINTGTAGDVGNTGTLNNEGTLASLLNKGTATLADTSIVTGAIENDSTLALGGQAGSLLQVGGATTIATNASLSGDLVLQGGTLTIGSDGQLTFASLGTAEGTTLTLGEGATLIGTGNSMALGGTTNAADGVSLIDSGTTQNLATGTLAFAGAATIDTDTDASGDEAFVNAGTVRLAGNNTQVVSIGGNGGNDVSNLTNAQLLVNGGRLDIAGVLGNAGTVSLAADGILNVDTLVNASGGSIVSTGAIFASSGIANRAGATLSSTGTLGGLVVNEGTITARGVLNGQLSNEGAGLFTVTGDLGSNGSDVANMGTAVLAVSGGDLTGVGTLVNASLGADGAGGNAGLRIATGRTLAADLIGNSGEILIAGTLAGRVEQTAGLLTNNGTIAGDLVAEGGAVSGSGAFDGDVMILADAIFAPGTMGTAATIDIAGMFGLGGTTSYDLGTADVIGGATNDLILAGSAVIDGGTFDLNNAGAGTYRLINTGGEGSIAVGEYALLNAAEGSRIYTTGNGRYLNVQVGAISTQYWDGGANAGNGAVEGGTGVWTNALGQTNWTGAAGALNNSWQGTINPPVTAVFAGTAGVVSVDTSAGYIGFGGMRFDSDGYVIVEAAGDDAPDLGANGSTANVFAGIASSAGGIASTITVADAGSTARIEAGIAGVTAATGLIVDGAGTLELAGNNEGLTGTVAVLDGTLRAMGGSAISNASALVLRGDAAFQITDDEAIGSLDGGAATTVALGENMLMAGLNGDDTTFGGVISGAGSFVKTGAGTMTLTGANTYTGTTAVVEGALVLGASDVLSDETFVAVEDAILDLEDNSDTVGFFQLVEGTLAGTGTLTAAEYQLDTAQVTANLGTGMLFQTGGTSVLDGTSAADVVAINAGTLRLGASERLADTASVHVAEDATFDLTAATETIAALYGMGAVELGVGQLTVGGTGLDSGFEGLLSGSGTLSKTGSGVFTLLGDQAGWTGDFEVLGGTLRYFGNSGGGALISGGTLSGNSTFASALTMTGGTLSPGYEDAPVGMISAQTIDLLGGTALFDFRSPEFGGGADLLFATGAITIADTEVAISSGDARTTFPAVQRYVIVQGDSLTGTFANGDTFEQMEEAPKLFWRLRYDLVENGVALEVRRMFDFGANLGEGATPNQIAVANTLSSGQLDIGDTFADAILPLADLDEADQLRVFDSLGGESLTSATTGAFIEGQRFADLLTQRIYSKAVMKADTKAPAQARALAPVQQGTANALAAPDVASVSMWMQGFGGDTQLDGDAVTRKLSHDASGFAGGLEARLGQFKAGLAGGYTDGSYDVRSLQASMQGETVHLGGYLGYEGKAAFAGLFGAYQNSDFDSTRLVTAANTRPLTAEAEIEMTGRTLGAFAGYRAPLGGAVMLTPMVGVSNIRIERDGFEETGADPLNLRVSEETREVTYGTAQLRLSAVTPVSGGTFEPYLAGGIEQYWGDLGAVSEMRFAGAAGDMGAFRIIGAPLEETVGVLGAGFDVRPNERIEIGASAGTRIGERIGQATVEMHARIRF